MNDSTQLVTFTLKQLQISTASQVERVIHVVEITFT